MRTILILTCVALTLGGCSKLRSNQSVIDGQYFSGKARGSGDDKHDFTATARPVSSGLDAAREAGRHQGTKYCIRYYGTSNIDWTIGPDTPADQLRVSDDTLTFVGRCVE
ncbi:MULTISPECIES: hypothetical protein [Primorskyibacter]|uniref:Lipoprotein n=1 Tax=Primorskyibacter flagellatus TaxID=1387277 RepID=A0A1W2BIX3_9RHOB|nr:MULTISPECIES: hypothetical protein [Primorskyibacter]SMC72652.1 hypothetical protein SAMN06295998_10464 [Primorskyibacter flagellatus]